MDHVKHLVANTYGRPFTTNEAHPYVVDLGYFVMGPDDDTYDFLIRCKGARLVQVNTWTTGQAPNKKYQMQFIESQDAVVFKLMLAPREQ